MIRRRQDGKDQSADEEVVACGDEDGREDRQREGHNEGSLFSISKVYGKRSSGCAGRTTWDLF